jgi:general stress protein 26
METHPSPDGSLARLGALIKDIRFAMLTTVGPDGALHSRPMTTQQIAFDGTLWFFTRADTEQARAITARPQVNVCYASPGDQSYASISGEAELSNDRNRMRELWRPAYEIWFDKGVADPTLRLIRVTTLSAEYWDSRGGNLGAALVMVHTVVAGRRDY